MVKQMFYLAKWFFGAKFFNQRKPLQSVIFISDKCNLACKHCNVYNYENPNIYDSKQLSEKKRKAMFNVIIKDAVPINTPDL